MSHGWLILDKPVGITSTQAGGAIKRIFKQKKIGHAGTLDPFACGVLPLALGEATKTMPFLMSNSKTYKFTLVFGSQTSSGDTESEIIAQSDHRPTLLDLQQALPNFTGTIWQTPGKLLQHTLQLKLKESQPTQEHGLEKLLLCHQGKLKLKS
ncbi:MAG: hypothetical protein NT128_00365 [Proteobacteria bacterium]|nr:hypothetical protein [Pseudomonadota bacterium]